MTLHELQTARRIEAGECSKGGDKGNEGPEKGQQPGNPGLSIRNEKDEHHRNLDRQLEQRDLE